MAHVTRRRFIGTGGALPFGLGPCEPMLALQSMVTHTDALRICTVHGAYAAFEEDRKGSLEAGKLADFVLLASDPHEVAPSQIIDIPIVRTVMGGRTTHEA